MKIECSICFDKIANVDEVVSTVCGHLFHDQCMNRWLLAATEPTCPQCRRRVRKSDLRKVFLNTVSSRNSDIFNSSIVKNLRDVQEDLCIMQTNLERENENLKLENERLKTENASLKKKNSRLVNEIDLLQNEIIVNSILRETQ